VSVPGMLPHTAAILAAIEAGGSRTAVAAQFGVSRNTVNQAIDRWRYAAPPAQMRTRTCLRCRQPFDSPSQGIRLCNNCKSGEEFGGLGQVYA